ncbi:hypothetical protein TNIN_186201 [Trichonephila inaurata madagascariensis]|uniref:Uncharacterized protein n=1 Tax=Trichonephila inaurata madagascariensis TaxID=2747483 RepID=A0A8X7CNX9_9ARAC|nr:hypothetical protein TNIN_186201 [Trichonephila inaurata madagascariensis]
MPGDTTDVCISKLSEALQERKTLVRELKTSPPCIEPACPDHSSSPPQAEIEEINTIKLVEAAALKKRRKPKSATNARKIRMTLPFLKKP